MKLREEILGTILVFAVIFTIMSVVIQRVEHQEKIAKYEKLTVELKKNSIIGIKQTEQLEAVEKGQIKTNELLKYQNKLLEMQNDKK